MKNILNYRYFPQSYHVVIIKFEKSDFINTMPKIKLNELQLRSTKEKEKSNI